MRSSHVTSRRRCGIHGRSSLLQETAAKRNLKAAFHLKVDTGMTRFGIGFSDLPKCLELIRQSPNLELEGVFTHLASAEVVDAPDVDAQRERFCQVRRIVLQHGFSPRYFHMANTAPPSVIRKRVT